MNRFIPTLLAACAAASPVIASGECGNVALIDEYLKSKFGEAPAGFGFLGGTPDLMALYANGKTDTWSFVRVDKAGKACVVASGSGWSFVSVWALESSK